MSRIFISFEHLAGFQKMSLPWMSLSLPAATRPVQGAAASVAGAGLSGPGVPCDTRVSAVHAGAS
jgi:hypothetical protein